MVPNLFLQKGCKQLLSLGFQEKQDGAGNLLGAKMPIGLCLLLRRRLRMLVGIV